jgi:endonuclease/exonuclease/phosphatase family metal-dependent hydrolase
MLAFREFATTRRNPPLKIITYNMQHDKKSRDNWAAILEREDPDIVLAQESLNPGEVQLPLVDSAWHQRTIWKLVTANWGSAVYVKSHEVKPITLPEFAGWVVGVEIPADSFPMSAGRPLRVFSVHAPTAKESYARVVNKILDMLRAFRDGADVVIGGDFNLTVSPRHPTEDRQTSAADLKIHQRLEEEFNLINCWQTMNSDIPLAQTLRWDRDPVPPYHCDGIFVPGSWTETLTACKVLSGSPWDGMSDHNPVVAEFGNW